MPDILAHGADWLAEQRIRHTSRTIVYVRDVDRIELSAVIGRTVFEQVDEYGTIHKLESRDFLVRVADLQLGGQPALPQPGDRIRESDSGRVFIYEVMAPGDEPPCRYVDAYRAMLRIHTKHVSTE